MLASRSPRRLLLGTALATALALTGCGTDLSPGSAAVVDGVTITDQRVDDITEAACAFTLASKPKGETEPSLAIAGLQSYLVERLIRVEVVSTVADEMDLTVPPAQVQLVSASSQIPDSMPDEQRELLADYFDTDASASVLQGLIGAHLRDSEITTVDQVTEEDNARAQDYLDRFSAAADVTVSPSYGTWTGTAIEDGSGSLSDPVSTTAAPEPAPGQPPTANPLTELPPSQVCG